MDNVFVFDNDIVEIVDVNRLSSFPQAYQETFLEALTVGRRTVSINGVIPTVQSIAAPTINMRIPAQYFAVEGRVVFIAQTDIPVLHPNPATVHDFYIYVMLRLDDEDVARTNVNPVTFAQTTPTRTIALLEVSETSILNVVGGGGAPTPPIGAGVPGPGSERLGFVLLATFSWDGVAVVFPTIVENSADVVRFGTSGLPPHGGAHVTTDPIPFPTDTRRGVAPPRTLPYFKNSISRIEQAAGSPITAVAVGQNGPAGDLNYDVFNPTTALGFELDLDFDAGSYQIIGNTLTPKFLAPPGGTAGTAPTHARSDHGHMILLSDPEYRKHDDGGYSQTSALLAVYTAVPTGTSALPGFGAAAGVIGIFQVDLRASRPDAVGADPHLDVLQFKITGGGAMVRWLTIEASGSGDIIASSTMVIIELDGSGTVSIEGVNVTSAQYRIALLGTFGQGT